MRRSRLNVQVLSDELIIAVLKILLRQLEGRVKAQRSNDEDSMVLQRRQLHLWDEEE